MILVFLPGEERENWIENGSNSEENVFYQLTKQVDFSLALFHSSKLYKVFSFQRMFFQDFFLLQSTFSPVLSFKLGTISSKSGSIVVKIVQKPVFTPCKSKKKAHVLLVNDNSLAVPVPLWITAAAQIEAVWEVLAEGSIVAFHNVTYKRAKGAFYCTSKTAIHVIGPKTENVSKLLKLFADALSHARV
jgi:hypothetical protein